MTFTLPIDFKVPGATAIPAGTWTVDEDHSSAGFSVRHMRVGTFRGEFAEIEAKLTDGQLVGSVKVASLQIKNAELKAHLFSPDFFDAEYYPEIIYESSTVTVDDGVVTTQGTLTLKGKSMPVTATGRLTGPVRALGDIERIGFDLETTIDRHLIGLEWNAPLPGGGLALGTQVTITVNLELALADDGED